jgi:hypothetical protein
MLRQQQRVPVTPGALVQRLNRRLRLDGKQLRSARSRKVEQALGRFFIVQGDSIIDHHVDVGALARKLGVTRGYDIVLGESK